MLDSLRLSVRILRDVWRSAHADAGGGIGLLAKEGDKYLYLRSASDRAYAQSKIWLREPVSADIDLVLDGSLLSTLLKQLEDARLYVEQKHLVLVHDLQEYKLNSLTADIASRPHDVPTADRIIDLETMRKIGPALLSCAAQTDMRSALNGVYLEWEKDHLYAVATDSYRLLHTKTDSDQAKGEIVVAPEAFSWALESSRLLEAEVGSIGFSDRWVMWQIGPVEYVCAPQAGRFPDWRTLLPENEADHAATFIRMDLLHALQRLQPFSGTVDRMKWKASKGALQLKVKDNVLGEAHEDVQVHEGSLTLPGDVSYATRQMAKLLDKIPDTAVVLSWPKAPSGPLQITAERLKYLQMPLHTSAGV